MNKDPWANRDEGMRCGTCIYFMKKGFSIVGRCRRHASTMQGYPVVFVDELGCGDHKLSEKLCEKNWYLILAQNVFISATILQIYLIHAHALMFQKAKGSNLD